MQPRCRLQTHLCLNTQSTFFRPLLPRPPPSSFVLPFFHLFLGPSRSSSADTSALMLRNGCTRARVFMRAPRELHAIYACACNDISARGEIYKHRTHTHLSPLYSLLTFMFKERLASSDEYRQVHAFFLSSSLSDGILAICIPLILLDSIRKQFYTLDLVRSERNMKASFL